MEEKNQSMKAIEPEAGPLLAIVIPAWRGSYLREALNSFRAQTDHRFRVYVGDDASPDDLESLVAEYKQDLDLVYHRFDENLGGVDLVAQWDRCISRTQEEPWIWLFSDDDEAEPSCVESFHRELECEGVEECDLVRFNFKIIGAAGEIVRSPTPNPLVESSSELLRGILEGGGREWRAPEHIFRRSVYVREGGFVKLPLALYSDLATWVMFAKRGGVRTMKSAEVRWRSHREGISSGSRIKNRDALLTALEGFMRWLDRDLMLDTDAELRALGVRFMCRELGRIQPPVPWALRRNFVECAQVLAPRSSAVGLRVYFAILFSHIRHYPLLSSLLRWRYLWRMRK